MLRALTVAGGAAVVATNYCWMTFSNTKRSPSCGVSLRVLRHFAGAVSKAATVHSLAQAVRIQCAQQWHDCAFVDLPAWALPEGIGSKDIGAATVFLSYAWRTPVTDLLRALEAYTETAEGDVYFWMDVFSHPISVNYCDSSRWIDLRSLSREIEAIGKTVLVLNARGRPLQRAWCLFEIFATLASGGDLVILTHEFGDHFDRLVKEVCSLDITQAQTLRTHDRSAIFAELRCGPGLDTVNEVISGKLGEWLEDKVRKLEHEPLAMEGDGVTNTEHIGRALSSLDSLFVGRLQKLTAKTFAEETDDSCLVPEPEPILESAATAEVVLPVVKPFAEADDSTGGSSEVAASGVVKFTAPKDCDAYAEAEQPEEGQDQTVHESATCQPAQSQHEDVTAAVETQVAQRFPALVELAEVCELAVRAWNVAEEACSFSDSDDESVVDSVLDAFLDDSEEWLSETVTLTHVLVLVAILCIFVGCVLSWVL